MEYLNHTRVWEAAKSLDASQPQPAYGNNKNKTLAEQTVSLKGFFTCVKKIK